MSTNIYAKNYTISDSQVNVNGELKTSALFSILQDVAESHITKIGLGDDVTMPMGLLWVLASQEVEISRLPMADETIIVKTWMDDTRLTFFPRHYEVESADGKCLVEASAFWALMNNKTREIVNPNDYDIVAEGAGIKSKIKIPRTPRSMEFTGQASSMVKREYIDKNGHMNNARYFDIIDEALAKEWNDLSPTHINARYLSEALLGDELEILWGSSNKKFYILCRSRRSEHFKLEIFLS